MKLQLITFNVNGLRSIKDYYAQSKLNNYLNFGDFLDSFNADILCFQEHKTNVSGKLSHDLMYPKGYSAFYAFPRVPKKIGYSGVVSFVKQNSPWLPIAYYDGFTGSNDKKRVPLHNSPFLSANFSLAELTELDSEGRCIITDHFHFLLLNIYFPNDSGPDRAEYRENFYKAVNFRCLDLINEHGKALIIVGDINITYNPLDHCEYANPFKTLSVDIKRFLEEDDVGNDKINEILKEFYSNPMRKWLADLIYCKQSWLDCFRTLHPQAIEKYTCWNTQMSARGTNYGTRIDSIFTSGPIEFNLDQCDIMPKIMGSDHCPVMAQFAFPDSFHEIQNCTLKDCKLTNGNIPRTFSNLDSFFSKKRSDPEMEKVDEVIVEAKRTAKITKISDYFQVKNEKIVDITQLIEIDNVQAGSTTVTSSTTSTSTTSITSDFTNFFNRPVLVPMCRHNEPCKLQKVKKPGPNRGRSFYSCARPGGSPTDPQARCEFFEWLNKNNTNTSNNVNKK